MKQVIECKRVCMYDVLEEKVIYIWIWQTFLFKKNCG